MTREGTLSFFLTKNLTGIFFGWDRHDAVKTNSPSSCSFGIQSKVSKNFPVSRKSLGFIHQCWSCSAALPSKKSQARALTLVFRKTRAVRFVFRRRVIGLEKSWKGSCVRDLGKFRVATLNFTPWYPSSALPSICLYYTYIVLDWQRNRSWPEMSWRQVFQERHAKLATPSPSEEFISAWGKSYLNETDLTHFTYTPIAFINCNPKSFSLEQ